jgi:uncharacterized membrane protein
MIKYIIVGLSTLIIVSCTQVNGTGEKTIIQGEDTVSEVDISLSKVDALNSLAEMDEPQVHSLLFKATGTEPGWFAEISDNKLRLVVDYGKDSLLLEDKFEGLDNKSGYTFDNHENKDNNKKVSIRLENKSCTDEGSGDIKDRQVTITYKSKSYKGCGSFIK